MEVLKQREWQIGSPFDTPCILCRIVDGVEKVRIVRRWNDTLAVEPRNPITDGHLLVVPFTHVRNAQDDPFITANVMRRAAELARQLNRPFNVVTGAGREAGLTTDHLHCHYLPRRENDGLMLPWPPGHDFWSTQPAGMSEPSQK